MTDKKTKSKGKTGPKGAKGSRTKAPRQAKTPIDARVRNHVNMILDPCEAPLAPTAYRGSDGILTRFKVLDAMGTTSVNRFLIHAYYPGYNGTWRQTVADPAAALTPSYVVPGPGQAFLLSTAGSQRVVGACTQFRYTGTELERQGLVYRGLLPASALVGASINALLPLLQTADRIPDGTLETKFIPSPAEEEYWNTGAVAPDGTGDRNVIVTIVVGSAAGSVDFTMANTLIAEWRPRFGVGMQVPTPNTMDSPAGLEQVRTRLSGLGNWWLDSTAGLRRAVAVGDKLFSPVGGLKGVAKMAMMAL